METLIADILPILNTTGVIGALAVLIAWFVNGKVVPVKVIEQIVATAVRETLAELDKRLNERTVN